jgi:hypothetical protein
MTTEQKNRLNEIASEIKEIARDLAETARENASGNSGDVYDGAADATRLYIAANLIERN